MEREYHPGMNIIVCLKQVPGITDVKIDPETNTLRRQGIKSIVNPFDTYALEEGVRLKERSGGKITALSMGPPQADEMLREAISCGADEAILISDRAFAGADTLATSYTLAQAVRKIGDYDLIICGRQTIDGDTGQVGPEMAEWLVVPFAAYVGSINEVDDHTMTVSRMVEDVRRLVSDEPLRRQMGQRARAYALKKHDLANTLVAYDRLLEDLFRESNMVQPT